MSTSISTRLVITAPVVRAAAALAAPASAAIPRRGGSNAHPTRIRAFTRLAAPMAAAILVLASRAEALVYWANDDSIGRANLNGTGANQRFIDVPGGAGGVAVDGGHVYWGGFSDGRPGKLKTHPHALSRSRGVE